MHAVIFCNWIEHLDLFLEHLVKYELDLFAKWKSRIVEADEKKLTLEGELEMLELAERMQARFSDILAPVYSNTSYEVHWHKH